MKKGLLDSLQVIRGIQFGYTMPLHIWILKLNFDTI